jgi:predicted pyridoxine 5'-phosphate oxidase superfamily flavin-nucleotide-binding protein
VSGPAGPKDAAERQGAAEPAAPRSGPVDLTEDMRAVIEGQRLCFAATVTPEGRPHLSPKGTIRVWDPHHLFFCDIASPGTRANLERNPWIELNVVDGLSRRGYRFLGRASLHRGDAIYREAVARIAREEGTEYPVEAVVLIAVERALPIHSPGYDHVSDERAMRAMWRERRAALDAAFERHVDRAGPFRPPTA